MPSPLLRYVRPTLALIAMTLIATTTVSLAKDSVPKIVEPKAPTYAGQPAYDGSNFESMERTWDNIDSDLRSANKFKKEDAQKFVRELSAKVGDLKWTFVVKSVDESGVTLHPGPLSKWGRPSREIVVTGHGNRSAWKEVRYVRSKRRDEVNLFLHIPIDRVPREYLRKLDEHSEVTVYGTNVALRYTLDFPAFGDEWSRDVAHVQADLTLVEPNARGDLARPKLSPLDQLDQQQAETRRRWAVVTAKFRGRHLEPEDDNATTAKTREWLRGADARLGLFGVRGSLLLARDTKDPSLRETLIVGARRILNEIARELDAIAKANGFGNENKEEL